MKILLVAPPIMDYINGKLSPIAMDAACECPPYGIYLLSSILKESSHEVVLADLISQGNCDMGVHQSEIESSELIGIGATSLSWPTALKVIEEIKTIREDTSIVLGGIHPTMFDKYILRRFPVDYIIRGEGEIAFPSLCNALEKGKSIKDVPNLSWKHDGEIIRNKIAPLIPAEKLSSYPLPDYESLPPNVYKGLSIESSRGCPFDCSFCSTSYRQSWRAMSAEEFVNRLEGILPYLDRTLHGTIHIVDDEFTINPKRAIEINQIIKEKGLDPYLVFDCRASDILYDGFLESAGDLNFKFLVGAESGYEKGLKKIKKGTTCKILETAADKLKQHGRSYQADFSFIIGLPWETKNEVKKTVEFAIHLFATYGVRILLQWYCQIPGSRQWDEDRKKQVVNEAMYDHFGFFQDLYLFRSGIKLSPKDMWDLSDLITKLQLLSNLRYPDDPMIEFGFPENILKNFPQDVLCEEDSGLFNLRQVSKPKI